jgi:hypothetical protein
VQNGGLDVVGAVHAVGNGVGAATRHHPYGQFGRGGLKVRVGLVIEACVQATSAHQAVHHLRKSAVTSNAGDAVVRFGQVRCGQQQIESVVGRLGQHHGGGHPCHQQQRLHLCLVDVQAALFAAIRIHKHQKSLRSINHACNFLFSINERGQAEKSGMGKIGVFKDIE